ncbi:sel1 repeat family protein, partial [Escherichia coli]
VMYAHGQGVPQDYQQTAILMRKAAENMYYPAQLYLGVAYFYGEGVPQDYRQAVYWLNEGIPGSYTPGHIPLNALYDKAHPADRVHSQTWYRKTAQRVMAKVQYNFGVWYYNGYHLLKDHNLALEWYRRA